MKNVVKIGILELLDLKS